MDGYVTFKRTALLMLMCVMAWCLPVKGQLVENNGYTLDTDFTRNRYEVISSDYENSNTAYIGFPGEREKLYVLIQLIDPGQVGQIQIQVKDKMLDGEGKLWVSPEDFDEEGLSFYYTLFYKGDQTIGRKYVFKTCLYTSKDVATIPLAVFKGSIEIVKPIQFNFSSYRIKTDLNTPIPFSVTIEGGQSFAGLENVKLVINRNQSLKFTTTNGYTLEEDENGELCLAIDRLFSTQTYSFTVEALEEVNSHVGFSIKTSEGQYLPYSSGLMVSAPYRISETDLAGLQKMADENGSQTLKDYITRKGWLTNTYNDPINTDWNENVSPARLSRLELRNLSEELTVMDVASFDSLKWLHIQGCNIRSLDLSMLDKLRSLSVYGTKITSYSDIKLPPNNPDLNVSGSIDLIVGTPVPGQEDYLCEMPMGSSVDLSAYTEIEGQKATFTWYKSANGPDEIVDLKPTAPGIYTLPNTIEENTIYYCTISTERFPNWNFRTLAIRLTRGTIDCSPADIQLLKNMAAANPNCKELQEFIAAEGWKESWPDSYWQDQNRKVAVDWDFATPARISKLRVRNMETVTSFDVSAFTELTYLDCYGIELSAIDLSKNTKLKELNVEDNRLASLDVSKCTKLEILNCGYNRGNSINNWEPTLRSLNMSGCTELINLDLSSSRNLQVLNLSHATKLKYLCLDYTDLNVDLSLMNNLQVLYLRGTTKLERYAINPPASVTSLRCEYTNYPQLKFEQHPQVIGYGIPSHVKALDVTNTNIIDLGLDGAELLYSTLKTNRILRNADGESRMSIPGAKEIGGDKYKNYALANGDTIDLSSEAVIEGIPSDYMWVERDSGTEVKDAFIPIKEHPGKFIANAKLGKWYYCLISNTKYSQISEINRRSGWRLRTYDAVIETPPATYDETEVAALKAIVDASTSASLKDWWDSKAWQNGYYPDWRFNAWWSLDQETYKLHLDGLRLSNLGDSLSTLDVSKFTELMSLECDGNNITELSVRNNSKLERLECNVNEKLTTLTLPNDKTKLLYLSCDRNTKLTALDITGYTNLNTLSVRSNLFTTLDLSSNNKLEYLWCNFTPIENIDISKCKKLQMFGVPSTCTEFDMNDCDSLKVLNPSGSKLKFSTVTLKKNQPWEKDNYYYTNLTLNNIPAAEVKSYHLISATSQIDLSTEMEIGGKKSTLSAVAFDRETMMQKKITPTGDNGKYYLSGQAKDYIEMTLTNPTFPGWELGFRGEIYTTDGDANLDSKVDVRDIAATASEILHDEANRLPYHEFGFYEADVNKDFNIQVADIVGIANLIMGKPVTKSSELRSSLVPTVSLTLEKGYLCMQSPVAIAGIQLAFTGMPKAEPLLGKAATFTQGAVAGDTTRILAYSLKGETIPSGTTRLIKMPTGVKLVEAAFSDAQAQSLKVETRGDLATANEVIRLTSATQQVSNYPNPFRSTTTLVYLLDEAADQVSIQVYALNGSLVDIIEGLSTQMGENKSSYTTTLPAGTYFYRLAIQKQGVTTFSKSNTFIIK